MYVGAPAREPPCAVRDLAFGEILLGIKMRGYPSDQLRCRNAAHREPASPSCSSI